MTLPSTFYEQSYPPSVFGPPPVVVPEPTGAVGVSGQNGHFEPAGARVPASTEWVSLELLATPQESWSATLNMWILSSDAHVFQWNGTAWVDNGALGQQQQQQDQEQPPPRPDPRKKADK